jgi:hypothetical protein
MCTYNSVMVTLARGAHSHGFPPREYSVSQAKNNWLMSVSPLVGTAVSATAQQHHLAVLGVGNLN